MHAPGPPPGSCGPCWRKQSACLLSAAGHLYLFLCGRVLLGDDVAHAGVSASALPLCAAQVVLLIRQMEATATQAAVAKVSLLTVGQQAIMDAYLCLLHLTTGAPRP